MSQHSQDPMVGRYRLFSGWLFLVLVAAPISAAEPNVLAMPDAFETLVNPACSHCLDEAKARASELLDDDPVLAWTRGKYEGGAIPIRFFLSPYRVISDTYGVFVFDPDAGFARGYEPSLDFTFYGWRNGIVVMKHKDGTLFSTLSGRAFDGPRKGERLKPVATVSTQWGYWNKTYPGSVAYRMFEKYRPIALPKTENADSKSTRVPPDRRLEADIDVLGISHAGVQRAYPLVDLPNEGGVLRDGLAGQEIVVLWYPATRSAAAYSTRLDEEPPRNVNLAFDPAEPAAPFIDRQSGSRFGVEGRAVSGPLKGKALTWVDSVQCRWFAWAAEYPVTELYGAAVVPPDRASRGQDSSKSAKKATEIVLVEPGAVTPQQIDTWCGEGFTGLVLLLDDERGADVYRSAAAAAKAAGIDLYYWIEVARNPALAQAHPRWMAALGMHEDWQTRFPATKLPKKGEVAKAYPWVPIGYAEAFQAHLDRIKRLLEKVPDAYRGLLLNDLQGGPASCGCGNLQCRWAIDYGVPATATKQGSDDAAARFLAKVHDLAPGKHLVPIWMTECEELDLPSDKAPGGRSTGLCGEVPCALGTCPRAFAKQLTALVNSHQGAIGLLTAQQSCGRDPRFYGGTAGWIETSVNYLARTPLAENVRSLSRDQLWLVVQGNATDPSVELAARREAQRLQPGALVVARMPLDQSYEPRVIIVD